MTKLFLMLITYAMTVGLAMLMGLVQLNMDMGIIWVWFVYTYFFHSATIVIVNAVLSAMTNKGVDIVDELFREMNHAPSNQK